MAISELEQSERMVVSILAALAERGVLIKDLKLEELGYELTRDNVTIFVHAVRWLADEGIIRTNEQNAFLSSGNTALGFTVTSRGFALLSERFEGDLTLGQVIRRVNDDGQGYAKVGNLLGGLLGSLTKSLS
jgi:hypothetical protein